MPTQNYNLKLTDSFYTYSESDHVPESTADLQQYMADTAPWQFAVRLNEVREVAMKLATILESEGYNVDLDDLRTIDVIREVSTSERLFRNKD